MTDADTIRNLEHIANDAADIGIQV